MFEVYDRYVARTIERVYANEPWLSEVAAREILDTVLTDELSF